MNRFEAETNRLWLTFLYERSLGEKNFDYYGRVHASQKRNDETTDDNILFKFSFSRYKYNWNNITTVNIEFAVESDELKELQEHFEKMVLEGIKGYEDGHKKKSYRLGA